MSTATIPTVDLATQAPSTRDDLLMFEVMHQAMRSQSRALVLALQTMSPTDAGAACELAEWYAQMFAGIEHHHTVEDTIFFPMMVAHHPAAEALKDTMAGDHHVLDENLHAVGHALAALVTMSATKVADSMPAGYAASVRDDAVRAAQALVDCLDDHLEREEGETFPIFLGSVPHAAMEEGHGAAMSEDGKKLMPFLAAWLLPSTTPIQEDMLLSTLPRIVRTLLRFVWVPRYNKSYPRIAAAQREVLSASAFRSLAA
jgi:hemerythrin-like domain-containing protein